MSDVCLWGVLPNKHGNVRTVTYRTEDWIICGLMIRGVDDA
jgi:hypothetical protein